MKLDELLSEHQDVLVEKWTEAIFRTYPLDTTGFMRKSKDQFHNPVGHRITEAVQALVPALLKPGLDSEEVTPLVDEIVRIRAVQDFTPARAIGVFYLIKSILRDLLKKELNKPGIAPDLLEFESKIDTLMLLAIDIFMQCKRQIYEMRVQEVKKQHHMLVRRANMVCEPAEEPDTPIK